MTMAGRPPRVGKRSLPAIAAADYMADAGRPPPGGLDWLTVIEIGRSLEEIPLGKSPLVKAVPDVPVGRRPDMGDNAPDLIPPIAFHSATFRSRQNHGSDKGRVQKESPR